MSDKVLIYDIETDSQKPSEANLKWFAAETHNNSEEHILDYTEKEEIRSLIKDHKYIIGFNNKHFDNPITENFLEEDCFEYKIILDLWECLAPKGNGGFGKFNKNRLAQMGYTDLPDYKLKTIIEVLGLDKENKGDIDYNIFKKNSWTPEEIKQIKYYSKKDIELTRKLYEWYSEQFRPLGDLLSFEDRRKLKHLRASIPSLAYSVLCNQAGLKAEFAENKPENLKSYPGGHHINPRKSLVSGNIIEIDFASAYPHAMMMCNLFSPQEGGWSGDNYYSVEGSYNSTQQGKIEKAIKNIYNKRQEAKQKGDKAKNLSYKLVINSAYGLTGNWKFKSLYNPTTASDCTHIVRTWMKKLAKHLEENGFVVLYGFTDSIFVLIPKYSSREELMFLVSKILEEFKSHVPFPMDSFKMDIEEEIKMIWFVAKNCYLFVTKDDEVKYKSTLLNKKTPAAVLEVFENYIKPKIIRTLSVEFTEDELKQELYKVLESNSTIAAEIHSVGDVDTYNVKTSLQYQISEKYGKGKHSLIPNLKSIGVGKAKSTKKRVGVRYCTLEEFEVNNLTYKDIDTTQLIKHLKPFYTTKEQVFDLEDFE